MDNLQWFKFSPADWMMGRIQRQSPQVQVDFLRVCCQYWKNEGKYSIEDAKLEAIDSYETLVKYRIIKEQGTDIVIDFLDEQLEGIEEKRKQASEAGKRSAEARKRRTKSNDRSTTVKQPFNEPLTECNRVEKSREEESRVDEEEEDLLTPTPFDQFWESYGKQQGRYPCEQLWRKLEQKDIDKILEHVPKFVKASGEYLINPKKYLEDRRWMDEELPDYSNEEKKKTPKGRGKIVIPL